MIAAARERTARRTEITRIMDFNMPGIHDAVQSPFDVEIAGRRRIHPKRPAAHIYRRIAVVIEMKPFLRTDRRVRGQFEMAELTGRAGDADCSVRLGGGGVAAVAGDFVTL